VGIRRASYPILSWPVDHVLWQDRGNQPWKPKLSSSYIYGLLLGTIMVSFRHRIGGCSYNRAILR